jgi:hypothetical protein
MEDGFVPEIMEMKFGLESLRVLKYPEELKKYDQKDL